jgi:3-hydroxyisobutyrate dehydrogenase-like beta-hydroxyacid dehydrogenase
MAHGPGGGDEDNVMTDTIERSSAAMAATPGKTQIGYIGLGDMGGSIAQRLIDTGWKLNLYARRAATLEPFRDSTATFHPSARAVAEASEILGICVGDGPQVEDVLFGEHQAAAGLAEGAVVVVQSTIEPGRCRELAARLASQGVQLIDAPVTGGTGRAREGTLTIPCGGDRAVIARCLPLLESEASLVVHMGDVGSGEMTKLLNNTMYAIQLALIHEATEVGGRLGLHAEGIWRAIGAGSGGSTALTYYQASMETHGTIFPPAVVSFPGGYAGLLSKDVQLFRKELAAAGVDTMIDAEAAGALRIVAPDVPGNEAQPVGPG